MADTNFNTAHTIVKILERVFPQGGALTAVSTTRAEIYAKADDPATFLRTIADVIDPQKKRVRKKRPAPKKAAKKKPAAKKAAAKKPSVKKAK